MQDRDPSPYSERATSRIVAADKLSNGVVVRFEDGQCGFFSDVYLFSKLPESERLREDQVEW